MPILLPPLVLPLLRVAVVVVVVVLAAATAFARKRYPVNLMFVLVVAADFPQSIRLLLSLDQVGALYLVVGRQFYQDRERIIQ